ncbi:unnamed protein product [Prorocentrum cordatum]|uniref:Uncharacterized protein n=1 Tax=Prorocentrum cordatum TaxID=2364126 RepID=A0ABN9SE10_9DINO|nr:unnamed protein product [Polarella glacialis]
MQLEMNRHLLLLIQPQTKRTPRLSCRSVWNQGVSPTMADWDRNRRQSFSEVWSRIDTSPLLCPPPAPARRPSAPAAPARTRAAAAARASAAPTGTTSARV